MREGVRLATRLAEHETYGDILAGRFSPSDADLSTDAALDAWLLANVSSFQHISGTCKMGPLSDPWRSWTSIVKYAALAGLRVADSSIFPDVVRANTNATAVMVGERGG